MDGYDSIVVIFTPFLALDVRQCCLGFMCHSYKTQQWKHFLQASMANERQQKTKHIEYTQKSSNHETITQNMFDFDRQNNVSAWNAKNQIGSIN